MSAAPGRPRLDPLPIVIVLGFGLAAAALAWPALRQGDTSAAGVVLICAAAAVCRSCRRAGTAGGAGEGGATDNNVVWSAVLSAEAAVASSPAG